MSARRILIVSDSITTRMHFAEAVAAAGYVVAHCAGEAACPEEIERTRPVAVVVDSQLAVGPGAGLIGRLRAATAARGVAFILLVADRAAAGNALPTLDKAAEPAELVAGLQAAIHGARSGPEEAGQVLIVDDSYTFREELGERLRAEGFGVRLAESARRGFEWLARWQPDLVLLDLVMPELSGDEACRRIKSSPALQHLPVVMITAREDHQTLLKCFDAGADDFITKSSDFEVIRARAAAQVRRKRIEDQNRLISDELLKKSAAEEQAARMRELYERAQAAVHARDEFLSIASHELKTPLSSLKLHVQTLKRVADRNPSAIPTAELRPKLENAERQIHRLTRLIEDLLDVSRIRNQKFSYRFESTDLVQLAREVATHFEAEAARAGCTLSVSAPASAPGFWDRGRLEQVLSNLISNAIKYGPGRPVEIAVEAGESEARLTVHDHGIGVAEKDRERIFNRFERAVSAEHFGGMGLGLYISREIVEAHGGRIEIRSRPGQGARFDVVLPRDSRPSPASQRSERKAG
jgi:signal transduction histidine kinase